MNLKQLSLVSLFSITSITSLHASETERKASHLNREFNISEEKRIAAMTLAEKTPEWIDFVKAKKRVPGYVNDDANTLKYAAEAFHKTEIGKEVEYWRMRNLALYKMQNYIRTKEESTDIKSMKKGIFAALDGLYDENLYVTTASEPIRERVKQELFDLVDFIESENK